MESTNIVDYLYITLKLVQLTMWGKAWPWDAICVEAVRAFTFASWMEATFPFRKCRSKCKIISLALIQDVGWGCLIIARMSVIDKVQTSKDSMESLLCHNIGYNQTPKWKFTPSPLRLHNRFFLHPIFEHMSRESFQLLYLKMRPSFSYPYSIVSLIQKKLKSWRKVGTLSHSSGVPTFGPQSSDGKRCKCIWTLLSMFLLYTSVSHVSSPPWLSLKFSFLSLARVVVFLWLLVMVY